MSYNGSGTFLVNSAGQPVVTGTTISSTAFNALTSDLATGLSTALTKDGQTTPTANIPLGGFKLTGLAAATARTDAASLANIQDGTGVYAATVAGTADAITIAPSPAITAYAAGQTFRFIASGANTGAVTIAVSGLAAKAITKNGTTALVAGDIPSGAMLMITYDGTRFILGTTGASQLLSTIDAAGDFYVGTAADTTGRLPAAASVAAHATTSDIWGAREILLTGGVVTFTDIADAPYVGAVAWVRANAAHVITDGAVFQVQGNANYTCAADDLLRFKAITVSTFEVTIFKADGTAVVASNGFTILDAAGDTMYASAADTVQRLAIGTARQVLNVNVGATAPAWRDQVTLGTKSTTTGGTSIDFTGLPAGLKGIDILFREVGTSGTDNWLIQIGDSGGIENTGYTGSGAVVVNGAATGAAISTAGFLLFSNVAASRNSGIIRLRLLEASSFTWTCNGSLGDSISNYFHTVAGAKPLSAELTQLRFTTTAGSDTVAANGGINIAYW